MDPHIQTYDKLHTDCQGSGDYVLSKSLDPNTPFEFQARFSIQSLTSTVNPITGRKETFNGTVVKSTVLKTGVGNEPVIETWAGTNTAASLGECEMEYYFDGVEIQSIGAGSNVAGGTTGDGSGKEYSGHGIEDLGWGIFFRSGVVRHLYLRQSRIYIEYHKWHFQTWGCAMNVCICLPSTLRDKKIVGVFGSPDGNHANDYMDKTGQVLPNNQIPKTIAAQNGTRSHPTVSPSTDQ
jgi:hypothetical protein